MSASRLATQVGTVMLQNPILPASGTFGSGREFAEFLDLRDLGAVVMKSVTPTPRDGCPPPRVVETNGGMLNAIGLQNPGIDVFLRDYYPYTRERATRVVVNIAGGGIQDYVTLAERLNDTDVDAIEVNASCPNVKEGGIQFGSCPDALAELTAALREATTKPLWLKLSPIVTDITIPAKAAENAGADALVVANTFVGMAIDIEKRRPILHNITGGLSGPAIHPMSLRLVWQAAAAVEIPIIGCGGVVSLREVVAFLLAGASAVEVGTINFVEPGICGRLVQELDAWLAERSASVTEIIGSLKT